MNEIWILDPTAGDEVPAWSLAASLDPGRGWRLGLLDISKPQGDVFLDELERLLAERGHSVSRYRKPTMARPAAAELAHEIAEACDGVVVALAD